MGLNTDASVRRLKGASRPVQPLQARAMVLAALRVVDLVVPFREDTPLAVIEALRPEVLAKGGDYRAGRVVGAAEVRSWGGRVVRVPLDPGRLSSTTRLIGKSGARPARRPARGRQKAR